MGRCLTRDPLRTGRGTIFISFPSLHFTIAIPWQRRMAPSGPVSPRSTVRTENTLHFYVIFITRTTHSCKRTEFTVEFMRIYALIVHKNVLKNAQIQYVHKKEYSPRKKEYIKIEWYVPSYGA